MWRTGGWRRCRPAGWGGPTKWPPPSPSSARRRRRTSTEAPWPSMARWVHERRPNDERERDPGAGSLRARTDQGPGGRGRRDGHDVGRPRRRLARPRRGRAHPRGPLRHPDRRREARGRRVGGRRRAVDPVDRGRAGDGLGVSRDVVITGRGAVTSIGEGADAFLDALYERRSGIADGLGP